MPIIYSLISRSVHVLAEFTGTQHSGNFSVVSRVLLKKIDASSSHSLSYVYDKYVFHYMVDDGLTYLCMTDNDFPRQQAFKFLKDVQQRFVATYGERAKTAIAFAFNADFQKVLQSQMQSFNRSHDSQSSKMERVEDEINQVKGVMIENIDKVLQRGEKIELLVDKTEQLNEHAFVFHKGSRDLRRQLWWKNVKLMLLIALIVLVIIYVIAAAACGPKLNNC
jgi:vesicle-associated membrane protein 7